MAGWGETIQQLNADADEREQARRAARPSDPALLTLPDDPEVLKALVVRLARSLVDTLAVARRDAQPGDIAFDRADALLDSLGLAVTPIEAQNDTPRPA